MPSGATPAPCACPACAACDSLETGLWGLIWREPDGTYSCLPWIGGVSPKRLAGDASGPYWVAP